MNNLTHLSLFSGIGGIDLAAEAAGFETVCQCEWADYPTSILKSGGPPFPAFVILLLGQRRDFLKNRTKTVTLISGGFPCQPFSSAGRQKGFADTRYPWPEMVRVISKSSPIGRLGRMLPGLSIWGLTKRYLT